MKKIVEGFGMFPNKFLQRAASLKFAKSTSVSTRALLAKFVSTYWQVCKVGTAVPCLPSLKSQSVTTPAVLAIL